MFSFLLVFALCCSAGHLALMVATLNRVHSTGFPRKLLHGFDLLWLAVFWGLPVVVATHVISLRSGWAEPNFVTYMLAAYAAGSFGFFLWTVGVWVRRTWCAPPPPLIENHTSRVNLGERVKSPYGDALTAALGSIPGNQILDLHIQEKEVLISGLDSQLEGFTIAHLSDLHFTGQLNVACFEEIVHETNRFEPDLVALTGDIIDCVECLPWIVPTLEPLQAEFGKCFVLGNHDKRLPDPRQVRHALQQAGFQDLGGRSSVVYVRDFPILVGGNERPWFAHACDLQAARQRNGLHAQQSLTIALSHSPDPINWARQGGADLMLAGHTHGGQFRLPLLGPILSPSRYGVRFASGTFYLPPTVLHVSRGLSGTRQTRFRCPPELAILRLTCRDEAASAHAVTG